MPEHIKYKNDNKIITKSKVKATLTTHRCLNVNPLEHVLQLLAIYRISLLVPWL